MAQSRVRSWLKTIAVSIVAAPAIAAFLWYAVSFLPHLGELSTFAAQGLKVRESANPAFYPLAVAGETRIRIRSYAIREAYWSIVGERGTASTINRQLNGVLWLLASHVHFNDDEAFGLWVECALGCGRGLPEASLKHFRKPITDLTEDELAGLVALVKGPSMFAPGTPRGEERKRVILGKYLARKPTVVEFVEKPLTEFQSYEQKTTFQNEL